MGRPYAARCITIPLFITTVTHQVLNGAVRSSTPSHTGRPLQGVLSTWEFYRVLQRLVSFGSTPRSSRTSVSDYFRPYDPHIRSITRNEDVYPNPEVFNPDRFMDPSKPEIVQHVDSVWGFGRRGCPGKAFAEANLWTVIANTIAVMDIRKVLDEDGNPITPAGGFESGAIRCVKEQCNENVMSPDLRPSFRHTKPFECSITYRSERARQLVADAVASLT